ncbi:CMP deaminase [Ferroacidibacillus organovorans]|uniref:tRNA-specific adenosine deaminase n=2 Tax=Ferroacidibacillus organovorans TaxID=1765683 RepID=A0A161QH48_9BACL|nr:tRNA-specific adenosine deaminase [Ferroacidibacillus organovorans]OAG94077.1 CMP deaminase [Ferroacidibacillus organovorans]OPG16898.1 tRNA-specific adenosine deaminase [Ferroacidibacillus organovorans]
MRTALLCAAKAAMWGEVPIGAIVVSASGEVLGEGFNLREHLRDPTAHAELIALRAATHRIGDWRLYGCTLYVTVEPCMMCAGAIVQSRIERVVFGADSPKSGMLGSLSDVYRIQGMNHYPQVIAGVLAEECGTIVEQFFSRRRNTEA